MIDHQSIVDELKAFYRTIEGDEMQDGDLTIPQLAELMGESTDRWRKRLKAGNVPPGYRALEVRNGYNGHKMWVMRKIAQA